jgi:DNA-binding MarR family transcriptional regulator
MDDELDAKVQQAYEVMGVLSKVAAAHDLSLTQLRTLAILRSHSPRMSELADYLGLDRSTVSGLVDRAVARGLVRRVVDDADRRSSRLELTAAGRELAIIGAEEVREALRTSIG